MQVITVSVVEDLEEIREDLVSLINATNEFAIVEAYSNAEDAFTGINQKPPDLAIMDISLPGATGIDCITKLRAAGSKTQFLIFTIFEDSDQVFDALAAGASGYILKTSSPEKIIESLREIHEGGAPMSASIARKVVHHFRKETPVGDDAISSREQEVLSLLANGLQYKEIGDRLFISTGTVRQHIHRIYSKLHVSNKTEAINKFFGKR